MITEFKDPDIWEGKSNWVLEDAKPGEKSVDGKIIIGRVVGPFFVPDGESKNHRFYSKELWEEVIVRPEVTNRLTERMMFGQIGHQEKPVTEEDLAQGLVSHVITRLWIDEATNEGMGEALILNTPAGQNLYIYLKAGSKLKTSSRAAGTFESGRNRNGVPVVDSKTYILETFDFVINPGFERVNPILIESLKKGLPPIMKTKQDLAKLMESKTDLLPTVIELMGENEVLAKNAPSDSQRRILAILERAPIGDKEVQFMVESFRVVGINSAQDFENFWKKLDSKGVRSVTESKLSALSEILDASKKQLEVVGDVRKLQEDRKLLGEYRRLGAPARINQVIQKATATIQEFSVIGTPKKIKAVLDRGCAVLEKYTKLGTYPLLLESLKRLRMIEEQTRKKDLDVNAAKLSEKYGIELTAARKVVARMSMTEAEEVVGASMVAAGGKLPKGPEESIQNELEAVSEGCAAGRFFQSVTGPRSKPTVK